MKFIKETTGILTLAALFILQPAVAYGQFNNIGKVIRAGKEDAQKLAKAYLEPLTNGIGAGLNSGWVTGADVHKTLGFSIQVHGTVAFIPEAAQSFDVADLQLRKIEVANSANTTVSPTIGGVDSPGPEVVVRENGHELARFNLPQGTGYHLVPAPMIQASVGIIKKTELIVRYVPEIKVGDYGTFQMTGFGIKHSLTQWLPADALIPVNISIMAGYSTIDINVPLNIDPQRGYTPDPNYSGSYDNQKIMTSFNTFTAKVIFGKSLLFIDIYGALGYETATMEVAMLGDYPVPVAGPAGIKRTTTVTDPFTYTQDAVNSFSFTGGLTLDLFIFEIFAQYKAAKYSVFSAGVGFSFR